jgi:hypothetical protein
MLLSSSQFLFGPDMGTRALEAIKPCSSLLSNFFSNSGLELLVKQTDVGSSGNGAQSSHRVRNFFDRYHSRKVSRHISTFSMSC